MVASAAILGAAPTVRAAPARANASRKSVPALSQSVVSDGSARAHFRAPGVALASPARRGIIARGGELSWDEADELLSLECVPASPRARSPTRNPSVIIPKRTRVWRISASITFFSRRSTVPFDFEVPRGDETAREPPRSNPARGLSHPRPYAKP
jgi:hypothetical protein